MRKNTKGIFRQVFVGLTNHYNMSCAFCPDSVMARKMGFMDFDLAKKTINELSEKEMTKSINFHLMGEPMLRLHYVEFSTYAHTNNSWKNLLIAGFVYYKTYGFNATFKKAW